MSADQDKKMLSDAIDKISEHFDSVIIFATRHEDVGTIRAFDSRGNLPASRGYVQSWLIQQDEHDRIKVQLDEGLYCLSAGFDEEDE